MCRTREDSQARCNEQPPAQIDLREHVQICALMRGRSIAFGLGLSDETYTLAWTMREMHAISTRLKDAAIWLFSWLAIGGVAITHARWCGLINARRWS